MTCPFCAEKIKNQAIVCRYCGRDLKDTSSTEGATELSSIYRSTKTIKRRVIDKFSGASLAVKIVIGTVSLALLATCVTFGAVKFNEIQEQNRVAAAAAKAKAEADAALKAEIAERARAEADTSWLPAGFKKFKLNPYMAYKKDNSQSCDSYGVCFPLTLITNKYCSNIFIAGNAVRDGVVYDYANGTAQGISPGQKVKMRLQFSTEQSGTFIEFTDANCN
jgi:hypothetical protein